MFFFILTDYVSSDDQAVIRHQDVLVEGGNITTVGQVLQLATLIGTCLSVC